MTKLTDLIEKELENFEKDEVIHEIFFDENKSMYFSNNYMRQFLSQSLNRVGRSVLEESKLEMYDCDCGICNFCNGNNYKPTFNDAVTDQQSKINSILE